MAKNGKRRTGRRPSLPQREVEVVENHPELPPPPLKAPKVKPAKVGLAQLSPLSVAFRHIRPNWRNYIEYVDLAARKGDAAMARFRACYETLAPLDKVHAWPEQICDLANVTPGELVGAVCRAIWESKAAESSMVSSIAHPELLMRTINLAKRGENYKDRELYFRMMGSLPDRKGSSINIYNTAAGQMGEGPELAPSRGGRLRTFDEEVIEMSRDLETPDPPFLVKEGEDAE